MAELIITDHPETDIVRLRLNRPDARNAFNTALLTALTDKLVDLASQPPRALILTGTGPSFSAGADLKEIQTFDADDARRFSLAGHRLFTRIEQFPAPVLAAVNGYALGGGCELACACDVRYVAASARFGQPEARVGMIPGWGGTFRLPRLVGIARAKELIFTAATVEAQEAQRIGLANRVFPDGELQDEVASIAAGMAANAPIANRLSKELVNRYASNLDDMIREESLALAFCVTTDDQTEAVEAFLAKREPTFNDQ